jgi:hypothetical protein
LPLTIWIPAGSGMKLTATESTASLGVRATT